MRAQRTSLVPMRAVKARVDRWEHQYRLQHQDMALQHLPMALRRLDMVLLLPPMAPPSLPMGPLRQHMDSQQAPRTPVRSTSSSIR